MSDRNYPMGSYGLYKETFDEVDRIFDEIERKRKEREKNDKKNREKRCEHGGNDNEDK